jgi:hypothetical protein
MLIRLPAVKERPTAQFLIEKFDKKITAPRLPQHLTLLSRLNRHRCSDYLFLLPKNRSAPPITIALTPAQTGTLTVCLSFTDSSIGPILA